MSDVRAVTHCTETLAKIANYYPATAEPARVEASQIRMAYTSKTPISTDVLSLRRKTVNTLSSWAELVAKERHLHPTTKCRRPRDGFTVTRNRWTPTVRCGCGYATGRPLLAGRAHRLRNDDVPALTSFLAIHAGWLVDTHPEAQSALDRIARDLREVAEQSKPRRATVGPCVEAAPEGGPCPGVMIATVRQSDDLLPSSIHCTADTGHTWNPREWVALGRRVTTLDAVGMQRLVAKLKAGLLMDRPRSYGTADHRVRLTRPDRHATVKRGA